MYNPPTHPPPNSQCTEKSAVWCHAVLTVQRLPVGVLHVSVGPLHSHHAHGPLDGRQGPRTQHVLWARRVGSHAAIQRTVWSANMMHTKPHTQTVWSANIMHTKLCTQSLVRQHDAHKDTHTHSLVSQHDAHKTTHTHTHTHT